MLFYVARHCETDWNVQGRVQGQSDLPLNSTGALQAKNLAALLEKKPISCIFTSDLTRAKQTAKIVNARLQVPIFLESGLRECNFGSLEGLRPDEIVARHGEIFYDHTMRRYDYTSLGGESHGAVLARHKKAIDLILELKLPAPPLLIGHGRGLTTLLKGLGISTHQAPQGEFITITYPPAT